jgi:anti-sigma factor RsiW
MSRHVDDHDLVLFVDGESPPAERSRVTQHLDACGRCREQAARLQSALHDVAVCYGTEHDVPLRSPDYRRVRLEAALREAAASAPPTWLAHGMRVSLSRALAAAVVVTAASVLLIGVRAAPEATVAGVPAGALPESSITPGAVSPLTAAELCNGVRPSRWVTESVRQQVVRAYGMEAVPDGAYELDALITPELGGSTDPANLWPQRYHSPVWNARVKDELERLLPELVCRRELTLARAQQEIAADWIAAYKRYFKTDAPLRAHLTPSLEDDDELLFVPVRPRAAPAASMRLVSR